jgi:hypothetical protein
LPRSALLIWSARFGYRCAARCLAFVPGTEHAGVGRLEDDTPVVFAVCDGAVFVVEGQVGKDGLGHAGCRRTPIDQKRATVEVSSRLHYDFGAWWRTAEWTFDFGVEKPITITPECGVSGQPGGEGEGFPRALANALGWQIAVEVEAEALAASA